METNDFMVEYVVDSMYMFLKDEKIKKNKSKILILGATYKEDCSDIRNSKVFKIIDMLKLNKCNLNVFDPHISLHEMEGKYKKYFLNSLDKNNTIVYDIILIAVAHKEFLEFNLKDFSNKDSMIFDIKGIVNHEYNNLKRL